MRKKVINPQKIRRQIFSLVRKYYAANWPKQKFVPGKTPIPVSGKVFDADELVDLVDASLDFWLTADRYAREFEKNFAKYFGVNNCLLTNSGSSANLLAVSALTSHELGEDRLKFGDEIITTAAGFPTTVNPIIQNGLVPVFLDVDIPTHNVDVTHLEDAITEKTKAVMFPHMLGNPFNLDKVMKVAKKRDLWVIEDVCDAVGAKYRGRKVGSFGDLATVSFYPAHHITMGEGGAVLTNSSHLKKLVASFRDWGRDCWCEPGRDNTCEKRFRWKLGNLPYGYDHKYIYSHVGYNLKLTDLQAAIGVAQLKKLPTFVKKRLENFQFLLDGLEDLEKYLIMPNATPNSSPSWFGFPITVREDAPFTRNELTGFLEEHKIGTRPLFGGNLIRHPAYDGANYRVVGEMKNSDVVLNQTFWIGVYPGLDEDRLEYVINIIHDFVKADR